ncbi:MAG: multiprotein bridging factor aMBF1 [Methanocorpusculum sp.]|jgi:putative transcription factor|uniref:HTH cro/C1-type domain-containing protein n=2 Tax=Methanocorpusculaceae TaxID=88404 RepID=A0AAX0Q4X5_9EURY|nr:multiprotein bridging factor aMBF1 [Methanocorpusculum sp.]MDD4423600.1 multiprotein bridging factor aMBF1 [Methanocorpusculum parvum]MDD2249026.1 multiprotein bridging factor aMBF1 [Methanocorpusculum sp.]MDD2803296.1 multiprotein bridging factor aMBF1 [Methanocorpusculum sp.]MDD3047089.1 multiprotein bridging factor aMBF1 [Methanocorpusculum sp.]MDD3912324.1 multiprotein bridging factor aMBF1 [Methanocorpusculum sp.]
MSEYIMQTEYCELCGAAMTKKGKLVQIEGAKPMRVCDKCAKLGTEVQAPRAPVQSFGRPTVVTKTPSKGSQQQANRKRDMFDFIEGDIVEDYPQKIAAARLAKGFSQKDLAFVLKMQEGDIKKFERGDRAPTEAERKKLEKELDIVLLDTADDDDKLQKGGVASTTLGDVLQVKRK